MSAVEYKKFKENTMDMMNEGKKLVKISGSVVNHFHPGGSQLGHLKPEDLDQPVQKKEI